MTPTTAAAMGSVAADKAGIGTAVLNSMRQVGGSLGIAIMGAVVAHVMAGELAAGTPRPEAFVAGFRDALYLAAGVAFAGALVGVATLRNVRHGDVPEPVLETA